MTEQQPVQLDHDLFVKMGDDHLIIVSVIHGQKHWLYLQKKILPALVDYINKNSDVKVSTNGHQR